MSRIDDELTRRFGRAGVPVSTEDVVRRVGSRRVSLTVRRRIGGAALAAAVLAGTLGGYAALQRAFRPGDGTPAATSSVSTSAPPATPCTTHDITGAFEGGGVDTAKLTCIEGAWSLAIEWAMGASGENPVPACDDDCRFWAVTDMDGDGDDELVLWSRWSEPAEAEWFPLGYVFILDPYPSESAWTPIPFEGGDPRTPEVQGTRVLPVGGDETRLAALSCTAPELTWTISFQRVDGSWAIHTVRFNVIAGQDDPDGDRLQSVSDTFDKVADRPVGQPTELCGGPIVGPRDTRPPAPAGEATEIAGVPYPACRVMRISGGFGPEQLDTVWVFQEEHFPGQGCLAGEGFQHLAIGSAAGVEQISDELTACADLPDCWPAAAVDLDGDGVDEIAVGAEWRPGRVGFVFYRLKRHDGGVVTVEPIEAVCEPTENCTKRFTIDTSDGNEAGVYCGTMTGPATDSGLVTWQLDKDGDGWWFHQFELTEQGFAPTGNGLVTHGQPGNYPGNEGVDVGADGSSLCGSPLLQLDDIDPERAQHVVELLGELLTS